MPVSAAEKTQAAMAVGSSSSTLLASTNMQKALHWTSEPCFIQSPLCLLDLKNILNYPDAPKASVCYKAGTSDQVTRRFVRGGLEY